MGIIRLLLALSVVAAHCGPFFGSALVGGQIAVQAFYIISGFYMSMILNEKYIGVNGSYKLFISNRFFRIYPVYWAVLLCTLLIYLSVVIVTSGQSTPLFGTYMSVKANLYSFGYLILTNLIIFGQDLVMFMGISPDSGSLYLTSDFSMSNPPLFTFLCIPQAWTLGVELTFYLVAPFLVKRGFKVVVPIILASFILRLFLYNSLGLQHDPWTYRFFPTELMFFLLGYVSYRLYLKVKKRNIAKSVNLIVLVFILLFSVFYTYIPALSVKYSPFSIKDIIYFTTVVLSIPLLFNFLKKSKLDNKIGELSYPVYISHMLVVMVCGGFSSAIINSSYTIAVLTIIFSLMLNRFISTPVDNFRQSRVKK